jgi:hypothetical protein
MSAFIKKVVEVGKTDYKHPSGVYKMYQRWKDKKNSTRRKGVAHGYGHG